MAVLCVPNDSNEFWADQRGGIMNKNKKKCLYKDLTLIV